jgi:uncharacterized protein YmfQ (DUF2313 family)
MAGNVTEAVLALLPKGPAWARSIDAKLRALISGVAVELSRVQARLELALLEIDSPDTATETIADWEHMVDLPSECTPIAATLVERQVEALRRWLRCGQWTDNVGADFLVARIVELGYLEADIEIRRFHFPPSTCESACDDYLYSDDAGWLFVYEPIVISGADDARVICEIEKRYGQAHLGFTFSFPLARWDRGTFTRTGVAVAKDPDKLHETALAANTMGRFYYGI